MALSRADYLTSTKKKEEYYSDFLTSFAKTPIGDSLGRVINEQDVSQSIRNLILTGMGERPFQPNFGSIIYNSLFELNVSGYLTVIEFGIRNTITLNEPRANIISVEVIPTSDEHSIEINIIFSLINSTEPIPLTLVLKRIR